MTIELNTPDKLEYTFYPVSDRVFTFKVRCANDAHLALSSEPAEVDPMYEIFLGGWKNTKSVIRKNRQKPDVVEADTEGIVNSGEFRGFWIRWYDNVITVGREGEPNAFMSYEDPNIFFIRYVGVCTGWGATGSWLIDAPTGAGPGNWIPATNGQFPPNSMTAGFDGGEQLYIARARHEGDLIPGTLKPSHGACYVPWGGEQHSHTEYEVLCSGGGAWVPVTDGTIPPNAFPGGETSEGETLYIGRATHSGNITVGKVHPSHGSCYIGHDGQELAFKEFEVYVEY